MLIGIHHTSFTVSDIDRSLAFYRNMLNLELVVEREVTGDYMAALMGYEDLHLRLVFLQIGGQRLELIQYITPNGSPIDTAKYNPGTAHVCFQVSGIHPLYQRLVAQGVRVQSEPIAITKGPNKGGYALFIFDPDGISLELLQLPPQD